MKKRIHILFFVLILTGVLINLVYHKEWIFTAIIGTAGVAMIFLLIVSSRKKSTGSIPIYDSVFAGGFVMMMIVLRWHIEASFIYLFILLASLMMGIPVFVLLWKTFPAQIGDTRENDFKSDLDNRA